MSTRATYCIHENPKGKPEYETFFYIHYDGYPSGAAQYFKQVNETKGENFTDRFAQLKYAERTASHESHGDSEYRYDISCHDGEELVSVSKRIDFSDKWESIFEGSVEEFIREN